MGKVKPNFLWHSSPKKLKVLKPSRATGISKKEDRQKKVYSTNKKDRAIVFGLISQKDVRGARLNFPNKKVIGTIFNGWPKQKYFYLYKLSSKTFKPIDEWQWVSDEKVKPIKIEKIKTSDYIHLVRKATLREKKIWEERIKKFEEKQKCHQK